MFFENKNYVQIQDFEWEAIIDKRKENQELINIQEYLIYNAINDLLTTANQDNAYQKIMEIRGMKKMCYTTLYNNAFKIKKTGVEIE